MDVGSSFFPTQRPVLTSVVFLTLHDTLLTTRGRRDFIVLGFFVFLWWSRTLLKQGDFCAVPWMSEWCDFKQARLLIACESKGDSTGGRAHSRFKDSNTSASFLCECLDTRTTGNRPWSWHFQHHQKSVHHGQPTMIGRQEYSDAVIRPPSLWTESQTWWASQKWVDYRGFLYKSFAHRKWRFPCKRREVQTTHRTLCTRNIFSRVARGD